MCVVQVLLTPTNYQRFSDYFSDISPDLVFLPAVLHQWPLPATAPEPMPHGAGNVGHWRAGKLVEHAVAATVCTQAVLLHRDPKTISMKEEYYMMYNNGHR